MNLKVNILLGELRQSIGGNIFALSGFFVFWVCLFLIYRFYKLGFALALIIFTILCVDLAVAGIGLVISFREKRLNKRLTQKFFVEDGIYNLVFYPGIIINTFICTSFVILVLLRLVNFMSQII